jgi:TadE-like protein
LTVHRNGIAEEVGTAFSALRAATSWKDRAQQAAEPAQAGQRRVVLHRDGPSLPSHGSFEHLYDLEASGHSDQPRSLRIRVIDSTPGGTRQRLRRPAARDRGAAAVEFALVSPLLFLLLFGILAYGIYFTDSLALRDGVRAAARSGSIQSWGPAVSGCSHAGTDIGGGPPSAQIRRLACNAVSDMGLISGDAAIKIGVYDSDGKLTDKWQQGGYVKVCAAAQQSVIMPFIPLPGGGLKHASVQMPIEKDDPAAVIIGGKDADPTKNDWAWC